MTPRHTIAALALACIAAPLGTADGADSPAPTSAEVARFNAVTARLSAAAVPLCKGPEDCPGIVRVRLSRKWDARTRWASSDAPMIPEVTSAVIRNSDDDTLAFVIAHEMAHVIHNHRQPGRAAEVEADRTAARLTCAAGYGIGGARRALNRFWPAWLAGLPLSPALYPSPGERWTVVRDTCINKGD